MKVWSISQLAACFGITRSTLLYYDRIGLLRASGRTAAGYRRYTRQDYERLGRIRTLRGTGVPLSDVKTLLSGDTVPRVEILENRLKEIEDQVEILRGQQHIIVAMLKEMSSRCRGAVVDKTMWVQMLSAAGMDEAAMWRWHAEFEARAPKAHQSFLLSLGIPAKEALQIRKQALNVEP